VAWRPDCPICGTDALYAGCDDDVSLVSEISSDEVVHASLAVLRDAGAARAAARRVVTPFRAPGSWRRRRAVEGGRRGPASVVVLRPGTDRPPSDARESRR
jgi:hypothetical protein